MSKSKKKNRVVRLTEQDYDNYIMSLKDEEPVKAVKNAEDKFDDTGA
ncbi:MAG: hypothetical protein IJR61_02600 [Clostridia bacterium]|nr:hypothetical protein [Clostridia bacterium]